MYTWSKQKSSQNAQHSLENLSALSLTIVRRANLQAARKLKLIRRGKGALKNLTVKLRLVNYNFGDFK
jgi:hypothetical protein